MTYDNTLLALTGPASCGKDTIADILVREHGFKRIAFADALRKMALDIDPVIGWDDKGSFRYAEAIDKLGYDTVKRNFPEARRFLQRLGTEGIRGNVSDTFWVDAVANVLNDDPDSKYVITDCRFSNEAKMIRDLEGWVVHVSRPTAGLDGEAAAHASEAGVAFDQTWDYRFENEGTLEELPGLIADLLKDLGPGE